MPLDLAKTPEDRVSDWLAQECALGSKYPKRIVLSTCNKAGKPASRIVAIREWDHKGILFFTTDTSDKYPELRQNPAASALLWLPMQQRQVRVEGIVEKITDEENETYWQTVPRDRQLKFSVYAPLTGQALEKHDLTQRYATLSKQYPDNTFIPLSPNYKGLRLKPESYSFYTLSEKDGIFSNVEHFSRKGDGWKNISLVC